MSSPFRKLVRIAVILVSLVLLFNFFGYYFLRLRSQENEQLLQVVNIAARQHSLCEKITKDVLLLLSKKDLRDLDRETTRKSLSNSIEIFEKNNRFLKQEISLPGIPSPPNNFEIKQLLGSLQPFNRGLVVTAKEVAQADSLMFHLNRSIYEREIFYNERKLIPLMDQVIAAYIKIDEIKLTQASQINTGKFISLVVAFVCLVLLVLEPAFKKGEKNYNELQLAKNELLKEKKYLASILDSQTNYVTRIDKNGNFTYANPEFINTFNHGEKELIGSAYYTTIYPKDLNRTRQTAEECWRNPGQLAKLIIRTPIHKTKKFLWTEWEFKALVDENNYVSEIQGIGQNVTEKIKIEESLQEAVRTLSYAMTYARMGTWKINFQTQELEFSKELLSLLEIPESEPAIIPLEKFIHEFVLPDDQFIVISELTKAL